jgi:hypothetical protein
MFSNSSVDSLNSEFFSSWLKKLDTDIAAQFVLSGVSLDKNKIIEAFDVACRVMQLRSLDRLEKLRAKQKKSSNVDSPNSLGLPGDKGGFDAKHNALTGEEESEDFLKEVDDFLKDILGVAKPTKKEDK